MRGRVPHTCIRMLIESVPEEFSRSVACTMKPRLSGSPEAGEVTDDRCSGGGVREGAGGAVGGLDHPWGGGGSQDSSARDFVHRGCCHVCGEGRER